MPKLTPAAIFVSGDDHASQQAACERYAAAMGWHPQAVFRLDESTTPSVVRDQLFAQSQTQMFLFLVTPSLDSLRVLHDAPMHTLNWIGSYRGATGTHVTSVAEGATTVTSVGQFMVNMHFIDAATWSTPTSKPPRRFVPLVCARTSAERKRQARSVRLFSKIENVKVVESITHKRPFRPDEDLDALRPRDCLVLPDLHFPDSGPPLFHALWETLADRGLSLATVGEGIRTWREPEQALRRYQLHIAQPLHADASSSALKPKMVEAVQAYFSHGHIAGAARQLKVARTSVEYRLGQAATHFQDMAAQGATGEEVEAKYGFEPGSYEFVVTWAVWRKARKGRKSTTTKRTS